MKALPTTYDDEQVRQYAVQAIRIGEITFKTVNDVSTPTISDCVLKGCKENKNSQRKRKRFLTIEAKLGDLIKDPGVREEAKRKGRKVSETDMSSRESRS